MRKRELRAPVGVDVSDGLLALCRAKVEHAGFDNVELRVGDMRELDLPAQSFDAVLLVFGLWCDEYLQPRGARRADVSGTVAPALTASGLCHS